MLIQLYGKDPDGNEVAVPLVFDTETKNWGMNLPPSIPLPRVTFEIGNIHPIVQDVRLSVGTNRTDGSRGAVTISGPTDHVTMAFGGPTTGGLGANFGMANQGAYFFKASPGTFGPGPNQCHVTSLIKAGGANIV